MLMDTQQMEEYEHETGVSIVDSLTGLAGNGFFQISLAREIERSERYGETFTLALIDIDSFSRYNRLHGPVKGDMAIRQVAEVIKENTRQADLVARYSGDVLAAILSRSNASSAFEAAERIREIIDRRFDGDPTVSVGLASYPKDASHKEIMIKKAQEALLLAKSGGKNRVYFFNGEVDLNDHDTPKVLIVDDDPRNIKLLKGMLRTGEYEVMEALNGEDALWTIERAHVDLVLLDLMMPGMSGYEVCRRIKGSDSTRLIPVVVLTSLGDTQAKVKSIEGGADDFLTKPPNALELMTRIRSLIRVKTLNSSLTSIENVLFSLANAIEAKDAYTQGHVKRVANLAVALAKRLGLSKKQVEAVRLAGILHDVGKIGVPRSILNKPAPLSSEEWEIIKGHPVAGYRICLPLQKDLGMALAIVRHHHEKLNGSGYPDGLRGEEIPLEARVMTTADIYDALTTDRPYRRAMTKEEALDMLEKEADEGELDREVVACLVELLTRG
jgi:putative two-component system response regulator